jgi:hypothetical protein
VSRGRAYRHAKSGRLLGGLVQLSLARRRHEGRRGPPVCVRPAASGQRRRELSAGWRGPGAPAAGPAAGPAARRGREARLARHRGVSCTEGGRRHAPSGALIRFAGCQIIRRLSKPLQRHHVVERAVWQRRRRGLTCCARPSRCCWPERAPGNGTQGSFRHRLDQELAHLARREGLQGCARVGRSSPLPTASLVDPEAARERRAWCFATARRGAAVYLCARPSSRRGRVAVSLLCSPTARCRPWPLAAVGGGQQQQHSGGPPARLTGGGPPPPLSLLLPSPPPPMHHPPPPHHAVRDNTPSSLLFSSLLSSSLACTTSSRQRKPVLSHTPSHAPPHGRPPPSPPCACVMSDRCKQPHYSKLRSRGSAQGSPDAARPSRSLLPRLPLSLDGHLHPPNPRQ